MLILNGLRREGAVGISVRSLRSRQVKGTGEKARFGVLADGGGDGRGLARDVAGDSGEVGVRGGVGVETGEPD